MDLYYLKARYYDPNTGRFISPDSVDYLEPSSVKGMNLYAYCGNKSGEYGESEWKICNIFKCITY